MLDRFNTFHFQFLDVLIIKSLKIEIQLPIRYKVTKQLITGNMCIELLPSCLNEYLIIQKTGNNEEVKEFLNDYCENRNKHFNFNLEETMETRTFVNDYYNETFVTRISFKSL